MLFSLYSPIRFKGVFMAYLYIYIPQIFPIGFFEESQLTATLISRKIRSRESVVKRRQYTNRRPSTDDLIHPYGFIWCSYKQLGLEIRLVVNYVTEGACLLVTRCNFSHWLCPLDIPLHMYIFYEISETQ